MLLAKTADMYPGYFISWLQITRKFKQIQQTKSYMDFVSENEINAYNVILFLS